MLCQHQRPRGCCWECNTGYHNELEQLRKQVAALKKQRDDMLAALEEIKGLSELHPKDPIACANKAHAVARAATRRAIVRAAAEIGKGK